MGFLLNFLRILTFFLLKIKCIFVCSRFYELSCPDEVLNKPCRFVNKKLESRCIQKFSYTYALVKNNPDHKKQNLPTFPTQADGAAYTLDYIEVRSGCSCVVKSKRKKRNKKRLLHENWQNIFPNVPRKYQRRTLLDFLRKRC